MGGRKIVEIMSMTQTEGKLIVFSAPSGAGKTTIVKKLLELGLPLNFSVSATNRAARASEINGKDYFFLTTSEFREKIQNGEFIEWEEVYPGQYYGSLHSSVESLLKEGKHVVFDIDVKGGINIKKLYQDKALSIFILPPSIQELENRLKTRGTEDELSFQKRISKAEEEMSQATEFDVRIVNEDLEKAVREILSIIQKFISN